MSARRSSVVSNPLYLCGLVAVALVLLTPTFAQAGMIGSGVMPRVVAVGDVNEDGSVAVRVYFKPLVLLIWLGCVVMALGGALSLSDRRLRVGAPKPAGKPPKSNLQPAE